MYIIERRAVMMADRGFCRLRNNTHREVNTEGTCLLPVHEPLALKRLISQDIDRRRNQSSGVVFRPDGDAQVGRRARLVEMANQHPMFA
jgi:hypothetical protein